MASSRMTPVSSLLAGSRSYLPPSGSWVSLLSPAIRSAMELAMAMWPERSVMTTGWLGDTSSMSKRVMNRLRSVLRSSYWLAVIHWPLGVRPAASLIACLMAAKVGRPRLSAKYVSRPEEATWVWASIRPGRIVFPRSEMV
jgi:hypothetical protein